MEEIRRQISWATAFGLDLQEISRGRGARPLPADGPGRRRRRGLPPERRLPRPVAALLLPRQRRPRARASQVHPHTRVVGIDTDRGRVTAGAHRPGRQSRCEVVVDCGGMFAAEIARLVDVRVPARADVAPVRRHRARSCRPAATPLPTLRDPDLLVYWRQEVDGLVMGGYERNPAAVDGRPPDVRRDPADFNGRLLPEDWDRFEEITANSQVRVPAMADVGLRKVINGPEAFTPDNEFCLGETDVDGFFVAAGFCAHGIAGAGGIGKVMAEWIVSGDPGMDLWHMDVRRFGRQYRSPSYTLKRTLETYETYYDIVYPGHEREAGRPLRIAPAYEWHRAARRVLRREGRLGAGQPLRGPTRPPATSRSGRAAGPVGSGRPRSASSTGRPARRRRCSTSRPSPSSW